MAIRETAGHVPALTVRALAWYREGRAPGLRRRGRASGKHTKAGLSKVAPATPRLIARDDLLAALDRAAERKVTILSAPAGSGKTSLLRAWADRPGQPRRLALVQVHRDQHDAQQFWLALLDAVCQATGADSGAEPPAATPDFNAPAMAGRVLSELADASGEVSSCTSSTTSVTPPRTSASSDSTRSAIACPLKSGVAAGGSAP